MLTLRVGRDATCTLFTFGTTGWTRTNFAETRTAYQAATYHSVTVVLLVGLPGDDPGTSRLSVEGSTNHELESKEFRQAFMLNAPTFIGTVDPT